VKPRALAVGLVAGLALSDVVRVGAVACLLFAAAAAALVPRAAVVAVVVLLLGWWWGSVRLAQLDQTVLASHIGEAARVRIVVTGPVRSGRFELRVPGLATRYEQRRVHEPVLLELAKGRAPPQGAVLSALAVLKQPRGPSRGFDERTWLRRRGVHVVLRLDEWHILGRRGGLGGAADRLRGRLRRASTGGLRGERAAVIGGVVLGDENGLSDDLRQRFRAAGLYHLLAVSGQNVVLVAGSVLGIAWLLGISRLVAHLGALAGIGAYVLAVGAQPSVVRAGIAGALCSLAWLSARTADRWHLLLVGAAALMAWNPYTVFDAGFQLSFAAVAAIFLLVPRIQRVLEGYPLGGLRTGIAVSAACCAATAPILWLQFHSLQLLAIPANLLAAPAVAPLLMLALGATAVAPLTPSAAAALSWLNGWCAA
jgi:competence protein ComEC